MVNNARLILSDYGTHGWGVSSPDLPALMSGAASHEELTDDFLFDIAHEAGLAADGSIDTFQQLVGAIDDEVYLVRAKQDHFFNDRIDQVFATRDHIAADGDLREYAIKNDLGDALFVVCRVEDTLRDASSSLDAGEPVTLVIDRGGVNEYLGMRHTKVGESPEPGHINVSALGITLDSLVGDIFAMFDHNTDLTDTKSSQHLLLTA